MPAELPYMPSVSNVASILEKIRGAGTPPKFTHDFLKSNLGFSSSNDRAMIKVLRALGFLSADGTPTQRYNEYKGARAGSALADGLREGWAELFLSDQKINTKSAAEIQAVVKTVTGTGDAVAKKIATTFKALSDKADWSALGGKAESPAEHEVPPPADRVEDTVLHQDETGRLLRLHQDIHIHLPPTSDVSVYRAIFKALKAELM